jgi:ribosomal protein L34
MKDSKKKKQYHKRKWTERGRRIIGRREKGRKQIFNAFDIIFMDIFFK